MDAAAFVSVPPCDLRQNLSRLLETKMGADVVFEVGGETVAAHRCVLAARSAVFRAELFGPMKEGTMAGPIQIQDMEPDVFKALLGFVYTDSMPKMEVGGIAGEVGAEVPWMQHLLAAADRYDLQRLKFICEKQLSEHISVASVMSTLALAEQHHCQGLKEACLKFIQVQSPSCLK